MTWTDHWARPIQSESHLENPLLNKSRNQSPDSRFMKEFTSMIDDVESKFQHSLGTGLIYIKIFVIM